MPVPLTTELLSLAWIAATALPASLQGVPPASLAPAARDAVLDAWRALHGPHWQMAADPLSGEPALLYGGSAVLGSAPRDEHEVGELARRALVATQPLHGVPATSLVLERALFLPLGQSGSSDKWTIRFRQELGGVPVDRAHVNVLLGAGGELLCVQTTALSQVSHVPTAPVLDAAGATRRGEAEFAARLGVVPDTLLAPRLVIAKVAAPAGGVRGRLAWSVDVASLGTEGEEEGRTYTFDAVHGDLIAERSNVHRLDVRGRVVAMATPGVLPDTAANPEVATPMRYLLVESPLGTVRTDANGEFVFPGVTQTLPVTVRFEGVFADVVNLGNLGSYVQTVDVPPNVTKLIVMNRPGNVQHTAGANVLHGIGAMRDWVRSIHPGDQAVNFLATAQVNALSTCSAMYFIGSLIRFGRQASGACPNSAYSSVVAHELGHWLNDRYGTGNPPGGMGEGNADVFAMYLLDDPGIGVDFHGPGTLLRTGLNTRPFCGDCCEGCHGGPHEDGEPWMGAAWKIRARLNATHGDALGDLVADSLFLAWMNAFDQQTIDSNIQPQWAVLDDDDGNLLNGTPNSCDIQCGFRDQGFPGLSLPPGCCP